MKEWIDPTIGLQSFQARKVALGLRLTGNAFKSMTKLINNLYQAYIHSDATLDLFRNP